MEWYRPRNNIIYIQGTFIRQHLQKENAKRKTGKRCVQVNHSSKKYKLLIKRHYWSFSRLQTTEKNTDEFQQQRNL